MIFDQVNCSPKLSIYFFSYDSVLYACILIALPTRTTQQSDLIMVLCSGWMNIVNGEISGQFFL